jgi:catechol 2,3-dioxygenase-like lactoylglutathione lyase family enzyme
MRLLSHALYLRVADIERSLRFYRDGLGFEVRDESRDAEGLFFAALEKDGFTLLLSNRPSSFVEGAHEHHHEHDEHADHVHHGVDVAPAGELGLLTFVYVEDADAARSELRARGVEPVDSPTDRFYGVREFLVKDPDGYYIAFAQRLR